MTVDPVAALAEVQWDFADSDESSPVHRLHPYPARFIPQIPRELIRLFHPGDDTLVFDPFCGSGTTLLEAARAGLPSLGTDLNPLATLIARVKTTPLKESLLFYSRGLTSASKCEAAIPPIPRLDHWFESSVQQALANLVDGINAIGPSDVRDALRIALSRIIVRVSNQESDTRYAAVKKGVRAEGVYRLFNESVAYVEAALAQEYDTLFRDRPQPKVLTHDVLDLDAATLGIGSVGLVVTSPPYPNAYEYWLYHKYRMYWLDMDPLFVRAREIGARPHFFKRNPQTEEDFARQMDRLFALLSKVVRPNALCCFLVGRSIIHGRVVDNAALLTRTAAPHGFSLVGNTQRQIRRTRKAFAHGNIDNESVMVFQAGSG